MTQEKKLKEEIKKSKKEWDNLGTNARFKNYPELKAELKGRQEARKEVIEEIEKMIDETKDYLQKLSITGDNKIDRDAISLCALKFHEKLKADLKEKKQDEK